jgi:hypothetical protein
MPQESESARRWRLAPTSDCFPCQPLNCRLSVHGQKRITSRWNRRPPIGVVCPLDGDVPSHHEKISSMSADELLLRRATVSSRSRAARTSQIVPSLVVNQQIFDVAYSPPALRPLANTSSSLQSAPKGAWKIVPIRCPFCVQKKRFLRQQTHWLTGDNYRLRILPGRSSAKSQSSQAASGGLRERDDRSLHTWPTEDVILNHLLSRRKAVAEIGWASRRNDFDKS